MDRLRSAVTASGVSRDIWIGLRDRLQEPSWKWSEAGTGEVNYTNWASEAELTHHCGAMSANGTWTDRTCDATIPFICRSGGSEELYVVEEEMTWMDAQRHCRQNHSDLASATSPHENMALWHKISENETTPLVWIGLFRDSWVWSDNSHSSFRNWGPLKPNNDGRCVALESSLLYWQDRRCQLKKAFCCHGEVTWKRIVRLEMTSSYLSNVANSPLPEMILSQIKGRLKGAKVKIW
ncbi:macrophage mannose receptor 1-like [Synchiropus splendidus]|uniref:macrophage mannose receptor 1-like n=1 Tax=Synchiropus splendidus TaxID=270530 RepID=UPI00237E3AEF|nr:macrophage mannose receptor 1-like [Synchiropus splendidus]